MCCFCSLCFFCPWGGGKGRAGGGVRVSVFLASVVIRRVILCLEHQLHD